MVLLLFSQSSFKSAVLTAKMLLIALPDIVQALFPITELEWLLLTASGAKFRTWAMGFFLDFHRETMKSHWKERENAIKTQVQYQQLAFPSKLDTAN